MYRLPTKQYFYGKRNYAQERKEEGKESKEVIQSRARRGIVV
jgi:hypothetical protein